MRVEEAGKAEGDTEKGAGRYGENDAQTGAERA